MKQILMKSGKVVANCIQQEERREVSRRGIYWACWTSSAILLSIALLSRPGDTISVMINCVPLLTSTYPSNLRSSPFQSLVDSMISRCSIVGCDVGVLTVSCPDSRLDFQGFADEDGGVRIGLLHGRVLLSKERAVVELSECWLRIQSKVAKGWQFTGRRRCVPRFGSGGSAAP